MPEISSLFSSNWRERKRAIESLSHVSMESLVRQLLEIMRDHHQNLNVLNSTLQLLQVLDAPVVSGMVELLSDPDIETSTYAALALGRLNDPEVYTQAVPVMLKLLDESCEAEYRTNLCFNIVESLGLLRASQAVDQLHNILEQGNYFLSFAAVHALGEIGDASSVPHLLPLLSDSYLGSPAVEALGKLGDPTAIEPIAAWSESDQGDALTAATALVNIVRSSPATASTTEFSAKLAQRAALSIGKQGLARLLESVPVSFESELPEELAASLPNLALLLGWILQYDAIDDPHALIRVLIKLLSYPTAYPSALKALVDTSSLAFQDLEEILLPPPGSQPVHVEVRQAAALVLGTHKSGAARQILEKTLSAEEVELVISAASALAASGDSQAFEPLLAHLNHPSPVVRKSIVHALRTIKLPAHDQLILNLLERPDAEIREAALEILASDSGSRPNSDDVIPSILASLADPSPGVRRAAIKALPYYDDPQIPGALAEAISDQDPTIRAVTVSSLAKREPEFALPFLHHALLDSDPWVRMFACRSLASHARVESLKYTASLKNDPMPPVRLAFIDYLAQLPANKSLAYLQKLLYDPTPEVQKAAEQVLLSHKKRAAQQENQSGE